MVDVAEVLVEEGVGAVAEVLVEEGVAEVLVAGVETPSLVRRRSWTRRWTTTLSSRGMTSLLRPS